MPRPSLYNEIHKGIRALLFDFGAASGRADFEDAEELTALRSSFGVLRGVIDEHAAHEERVITEPLRAADPAVADALSAHHHNAGLGLDELDARLSRLDAGSGSASEDGNRFYLAFNKWMGDFLLHMDEEEGRAMPALWSAHSDEEIMGMQVQIRSAIPPERMGFYLSWMIPAMSPQERFGLLADMRANAPLPVYQGVRELAQQVLAEASWQQLDASLGTTA